MSPIAIVFLILAIAILWGGLTASMLYLRAAPERTSFPPGGEDHDEREDSAIPERDT